jgi:hypothetical protein
MFGDYSIYFIKHQHIGSKSKQFQTYSILPQNKSQNVEEYKTRKNSYISSVNVITRY